MSSCFKTAATADYEFHLWTIPCCKFAQNGSNFKLAPGYANTKVIEPWPWPLFLSSFVGHVQCPGMNPFWIVENPQRGPGKIQGVDKTHEHDGRKNVEFGWIWWSKETSGGCSKQRRGGEKSLMLEILWLLCCFPSCFPLFFASWLQHIAGWSSNKIMVW